MQLQVAPKCPACGAEAKGLEIGEDYTCPYCGSVSNVAAPPPVVQQIFVQPEIIKRVVMVDAATDRTTLPCPRCELPLFEGKTDRLTLHGCGQCGGVWLDNTASSNVVYTNDVTLLTLTDKAAKAKKVEIDPTPLARCPLDGDPLTRTIVRGVELDVCAAHGTWFDAGEVRRLKSIFQEERLAVAAGEPYDYEAAAKDDTSRYVKGAFDLLRAVLTAAQPPR